MLKILSLIFIINLGLYAEVRKLELKNPYEVTIQELEVTRLEQRDEPPSKTKEKNPVPEVSKPGTGKPPQLNQTEKTWNHFKLFKPTQYSYVIEKSFSDNPTNPHRGISIKSNSPEVLTANDGRIVSVGKMEGYRTYIIVDHGNGVYTVYGNLENAQVEEGQTVKRGNVIGKTPKDKSLYFQVNIGNRTVDPLKHLN